MVDKVKRLWVEAKKACVGGLVAFAGWGALALADGQITRAEWCGLVVPLLTGLGVYHVRNQPPA